MAVVVVVVVAEAPSSVVVMVMWHCSRFDWVVSLFNLVNLASRSTGSDDESAGPGENPIVRKSSPSRSAELQCLH